jgi:hypothetical protein
MGFVGAAALSVALSGCLPTGDGFVEGVDRSGVVPLDGPITTAPAGSCHYRDALPDPVCTPADRDSRVTQDNIASTICAPGWSKEVRPPASVTEPIKKERMRAYGVAAPMGTIELDHEIPIGLAERRRRRTSGPSRVMATPGRTKRTSLKNTSMTWSVRVSCH